MISELIRFVRHGQAYLPRKVILLSRQSEPVTVHSINLRNEVSHHVFQDGTITLSGTVIALWYEFSSAKEKPEIKVVLDGKPLTL